MAKPPKTIDLDSPKQEAANPGKGIGLVGKESIRFNPLAVQFDIEDHEVEFVDALYADPYKNATAAWMLLHPACDSYLSAKVKASEMLKKPNVQKYAEYVATERTKPKIISREFVMLRLRHVAERAMAATPVFDKDGQPTGEYKADFGAANKALELLGKQLGMFKEQTELKIKGDRPTLNVQIMGLPDETECPTVINDHIKKE